MYNTKKQDKRTQLLLQKVRCLPCASNESVYDSQSSFSIMIRDLVNNRIQSNYTEEEILQELTNTYGSNILYDTPFNEDTYILWGSVLMVIIMGILIIIRLRYIQ